MSVLRRLRSGRPAPIRAAPPTGMLAALRDGPAPLAPGAAAAAEAGHLEIVFVVPPFRRGSGGHGAIARIVRELEALGHACELRVLDDERRHAHQDERRLGEDFRAWFEPVAAPVRAGLDGWAGADVVVATGWQTVPAVLRLGGAKARAYLVQDHEPEFYATSIEREWAAWTYRQGLHHIASSSWLAGLLAERYGAAVSAFAYGVDHDVYRPLANVARRPARVLFYARPTTPRRAVPLGLLALEELHRRRPDAEIALFGEARPIAAPAGAVQLGVLDDAALTRAYAEATVGVVLSLTNPSLVPLEMLAAGLPVVDIASASMLAEFGREGPVTLAALDPLALCAAIERLLDAPACAAHRAAQGIALMAPRTFAAAGASVEAGLREALRAG